MNGYFKQKGTLYDNNDGLKNQLFLECLASMPSGIIQLKPTGEIVFCNSKLIELLCLSPDMLSGNCTPLFLQNVCESDRENLRLAYRALKATKQEQTGVFCVIHPETKQHRYIHYCFWQIESEAGVEFFAVKLTDRSSVVDKLMQLEHELSEEKKINDIRTKSMHFISHELREPLSVIMSSAELLKMFQEIPDASAELFRPSVLTGSIINEVRHMSEIISRLLMIGQLERKSVRPELGEVDVLEIIQEVCEQRFSPFKDGRSAVIEGMPVRFILDTVIIKLAIYNLIENAFKYSAGCPPPVIKVALEGKQLKITVTDYGIGIPQDEHKQLFHTFFRASNSERIQGMGLGLTIVKQAVSMHGGSVSLQSELHRGTTFTILIPENQG